jgi:hypothetical protein
MCEHILVHLDTKKYIVPQGGYNNRFVRIDMFFCEKCAEMIIKKQEGYARCENDLDWY